MASRDSIMRPALRSTSSLAFLSSSWCDTHPETPIPAAKTRNSTMLNFSLRPMEFPLYTPLTTNSTLRIRPYEPRRLARPRRPLGPAPDRRVRGRFGVGRLRHARPARLAGRGGLRGLGPAAGGTRRALHLEHAPGPGGQI